MKDALCRGKQIELVSILFDITFASTVCLMYSISQNNLCIKGKITYMSKVFCF